VEAAGGPCARSTCTRALLATNKHHWFSAQWACEGIDAFVHGGHRPVAGARNSQKVPFSQPVCSFAYTVQARDSSLYGAVPLSRRCKRSCRRAARRGLSGSYARPRPGGGRHVRRRQFLRKPIEPKTNGVCLWRVAPGCRYFSRMVLLLLPQVTPVTHVCRAEKYRHRFFSTANAV